MYSIGLTGGIGSGKNTVAELFVNLGISVIDADAIAHELTATGGIAIPAIREAFGDTLLTPRGELDRNAMRDLVFSNPDARRRLETILHPMIRTETDRQAANARSPYVVLMIPLLLESSAYRDRVQRIAVVDCPEEQQIERAIKRSRLDRDTVVAIMHTQLDRNKRLAAADDIIDNSRDIAWLKPQVERLHARYLVLAEEHKQGTVA